MARLGNVFTVIAYNALAVVGLLMLVEGGVRIAYPDIQPPGTSDALIADSVYGASAGLRPESSGLSHGAQVTVTAEGFIRYAPSPAAATTSWLFLGDSVTMGIGVPPDSTFAGRFSASTDSVLVLNPSLIGYSVYDYANVLEQLLAEKPRIDRVVVFWCLNDLYRPTTTDPNARVRRRLSGVLAFLRQHVRTYLWAKHVFADRPRTYFEHDARLYQDEALYAGALSTLLWMHNLAAAHDARIQVVVLPYEYQLRDGMYAQRSAPQAKLLADLQAAGVTAWDAGLALSDSLKPAAASALYLFGDGIHFSKLGHRHVYTLLRYAL